MSDDNPQCLYRELHEGMPDEEVASKEHVLAEVLGGQLKLPSGTVCKACNNRLNTDVDTPIMRTFRGLINYFGLADGKRGERPNRYNILVEAGGKILEAQLFGNGSIKFSPCEITKDPEGQENDDFVREFVIVNEGQAHAIRKKYSEQGYQWREQVYEGIGIRILSLPVEGDFLSLFRAVAKTALNYLVFRHPEFANVSCLSNIKRFVRLGLEAGKQPYVATSKAILSGANSAADGLAALHRIKVAAIDNTLDAVVNFFGKHPFMIRLSDSYQGKNFYIEHEFDLSHRVDRKIDLWGSHPDEIYVPAAGDCQGSEESRIMRTDGHPQDDNHLYIHQRYEDGKWSLCDICSNAAAARPHRDAVFRCHYRTAGLMDD